MYPHIVFVCVSLSLSLCLCLSLSVSVCLCLSLSVSVCLFSVCLVSVCLCLPLSVSACLSLSVSVCLSVSLSVCLPVCLSICVFCSTSSIMCFGTWACNRCTWVLDLLTMAGRACSSSFCFWSLSSVEGSHQGMGNFWGMKTSLLYTVYTCM